jgi:hypothetical protein
VDLHQLNDEFVLSHCLTLVGSFARHLTVSFETPKKLVNKESPSDHGKAQVVRKAQSLLISFWGND